MKIKPLIICFSFVCAGVPSFGQSTWTGAADSDWANGSNWIGGAPSNDGTAIFSGPVTPNQPDIGAAKNIRYLNIQSGGWVFSSDDGGGGLGTLNFRPIAGQDAPNELNVTGAGLTVIDAHIRGGIAYRGPDLFVDAGSKLVVSGEVQNPTGRRWYMEGTGTFIFNQGWHNSYDFSGAGLPRGAGNSGSYIFNGGGTSYIDRAVIGSGNFVGGDSTLRIARYETLAFSSGSKLAPGGDGSTVLADGYDGGDVIGTLTFVGTHDGIRSYVSMDSSSSIEMDIGSTLGDNDLIEIGDMHNGNFNLGGSTLALRGGGVHDDGAYTLIQELDVTGYTGTFGAITYNGLAADPSNFWLTYNPDNVILNIMGMAAVIPELETSALFLICGLGLVLVRRKKQR